MRTMLMVETRPQNIACLASTPQHWSHETWTISRAYHMRRCIHARWWLVVADNAVAARAIIRAAELCGHMPGIPFKAVVKSKHPDRVADEVEGRILASGGKP